jgi:hypothetical protein
MPADSFLDWVSLNQSYHPAPLYPVKGAHDVVPVSTARRRSAANNRPQRGGATGAGGAWGVPIGGYRHVGTTYQPVKGSAHSGLF